MATSTELEKLKQLLYASNDKTALNELAKNQAKQNVKNLAVQKELDKTAVMKQAESLLGQIEGQKRSSAASLHTDAKNAYREYMQTGKNLDEYLAAKGISGGAAESSKLAAELGYGSNVATLKSAYRKSISDLVGQQNNIREDRDNNIRDIEKNYLEEQRGILNNYNEQLYNNKKDELSQTADIEKLLYNLNYQENRDSISDSKWQQEFDYNKSQDVIKNNQWQEQFDYNKSQDAIKNSQWQQEFDYEKQRDGVSDSQWLMAFEQGLAKDKEEAVRWAKEYALKVAEDVKGNGTIAENEELFDFYEGLAKCLEYEDEYGMEVVDSYLNTVGRDFNGNPLKTLEKGGVQYTITNKVYTYRGSRYTEIAGEKYTAFDLKNALKDGTVELYYNNKTKSATYRLK